MIGSFEPGICLMMTRVQDDWLFWPWNLIHTLKVVGQGKQAEYLIRKDKVKVPENLPKGDYVLSFRWTLYFVISHQITWSQPDLISKGGTQRELHKCGSRALLSNLSENQDHEIEKGNYQKKYLVWLVFMGAI